jgi:hypothetical protein
LSIFQNRSSNTPTKTNTVGQTISTAGTVTANRAATDGRGLKSIKMNCDVGFAIASGLLKISIMKLAIAYTTIADPTKGTTEDFLLDMIALH